MSRSKRWRKLMKDLANCIMWRAALLEQRHELPRHLFQRALLRAGTTDRDLDLELLSDRLEDDDLSFISPSLDDALKYLRPQQALELETVVLHLEANRESLVQTGHPSAFLDVYHWLWLRLGKNYYTTLPDRSHAWRIDELVRGEIAPRDGTKMPITVPPQSWPVILEPDDDLVEAGRVLANSFAEINARLAESRTFHG